MVRYVWTVRDVVHGSLVDLSSNEYAVRSDCAKDGIREFAKKFKIDANASWYLCIENSGSAGFPQYATYDQRIKTFNNTWPRAIPQKPSVLAECGMYYTGTGDKVSDVLMDSFNILNGMSMYNGE